MQNMTILNIKNIEFNSARRIKEKSEEYCKKLISVINQIAKRVH